MSFVEIAKYLKTLYPNSKTKTAQAPAFLIKFLANFDGEIKAILPLLGKPMITSGEKAKRIFGISFIPAKVSVRESADYLIKNGFIKSGGEDDGGDDVAFLATIA